MEEGTAGAGIQELQFVQGIEGAERILRCAAQTRRSAHVRGVRVGASVEDSVTRAFRSERAARADVSQLRRRIGQLAVHAAMEQG